MTALDLTEIRSLWSAGRDTQQIAKALSRNGRSVTEAEVYNVLSLAVHRGGERAA